MKFHVVTLFPEVIDAYTQASILGRAQRENILTVTGYQLREWVTNKWGKADERPYGGGPGMILQAEPVILAVENIKKSAGVKGKKAKIIITAAGGKPLTNAYAKKLSKLSDVIIICGRYEGIDARAKKVLKAQGWSIDEVSVGPYILTGGEVPALAIIDATARQIPGVLGKLESLEEGRVASHEMYTRPEVLIYKGKKYRVPKVLLSGHQANIDIWKQKKRSNPAAK
ncbi:MAG TPA: tRNA (guanosine(37)-N1)-methyltransferase TrmD [Candidatus Paceibacterota bacterium]